VIDCWRRMREVEDSFSNKGQRHTKEVKKMHSKRKHWLFLKKQIAKRNNTIAC